jgi:hypothetical protein
VPSLDLALEVGERAPQICHDGLESGGPRRASKRRRDCRPQSTEYYRVLLAKLNEQESSIEGLQKERDNLVTRRDGLRKDLEENLVRLAVS